VADALDGAADDLVDAELVHLVRAEARDPLLGLPRKLGLAGPVAAQADLDVADGVDLAGLDEPEHRRAVGDLDAKDLAARVRVRVEAHEPDGTVAGRARADVRLGDRMVSPERHRDQARV